MLKFGETGCVGGVSGVWQFCEETELLFMVLATGAKPFVDVVHAAAAAIQTILWASRRPFRRAMICGDNSRLLAAVAMVILNLIRTAVAAEKQTTPVIDFCDCWHKAVE